MQVLVNTRGHYPKGFPKSGGFTGSGYDPAALEKASDTPQLDVYKTAVQDVQGSALVTDFFQRGLHARDWWYARWANQTCDGRKWGDPARGIAAWPWPGASDSRIRTTERTINEHRTIQTFALRNMKWQAKSTRPAVTVSESQRATTLFNFMLFSHGQAELHLELNLALAWRNGYGAALIDVGWKQRRQMNYIDVNVMGLQEFVNEPAVQQFIGSGVNIPIGENLDITDLQAMIMDPAYADDLAKLLRAVSHDYLTLREAGAKLDELRQVRTVEIPIPDTYESRPQLVAYRPEVDVLFPPAAHNLQIVPFYDKIEFVSETTLRDRVVTDGYDKKFVEQALARRGPTGNTDWRLITNVERAAITASGYNALENDIELHHFYTLAQDRGVPVRFCTVFHMDLEIAAKHRPAGYHHGEATLHPMRFEINDRPILSSRGIAEIAYTWEQELKVQYDASNDRTSIALRPPLLTTYDKLQKLKDYVQPGAIIPMGRPFDEAKWMQMPPWDRVSVLIIEAVEKRVRDHFGIFGNDVDPDLKKLRREELVDDLLTELKPVAQQVMRLFPQLIPDNDVGRIIGLARFGLTKDVLATDFDLTGTVDLRDIDSDWFKEKRQAVIDLVNLDTMGLVDRTELVHTLAEIISPDFADRIIKNPQAATQAEVQDEQAKIDLIIGSGQDQPLPQGANYQLRLQTLDAKLQAITQNPATMQIVQQNPKIMMVIMNRRQFLTRQLQQQQNAQIGRMQVSETFSKQAPQAAQPQSALLGGSPY